MKLEDQVCSLELAKKLKKLGVNQESQFYWRLAYHTSENLDAGLVVSREGIFGDYGIQYRPHPRFTTADFKWNEADLLKLDQTEISAFTVAELGEMLPVAYSSSRGANNQWMCVNEMKSNTQDGKIRFADSEAHARAKMLIYLLEKKLISVG